MTSRTQKATTARAVSIMLASCTCACLVFCMTLPGCGTREAESSPKKSAAPAETKSPPGDTTQLSAGSNLRVKFQDFNLVFVSFDALQAAHVGCLGYSRDITPTIDSLAAKGCNFRQAISVSSWTVPSSMTWFTGVYPSEHNMVNKYAIYDPPRVQLADLRDVSPDLLTLADILKASGYRTGGFTGNAGVSGGFGYEQGFDEYYYEAGKFGRMRDSVPRAIEWVKANRDQKFFLFLHGYDVHGQSIPPGGFDYRFVDQSYDERYTGAELEQELLREEGLEKGALEMRQQDIEFWRAIYDEKINRVDRRFSEFVEALQSMDLMEKTIFVLTADHGTEFFEHDRIDHGFTLYQELIHVPLIICLPGQTDSVDVDQYVSSIDLLPTILDLLDVAPTTKTKQQLRGHSLVPRILGKQEPERDIVSETNYREYTYKRSLLAPDGWKLIYTLETRHRELYFLPEDPGEKTDLALANPEKADLLQRRLFAHFESIGHDLTARTWPIGLNPVYPSQGK